MQKRNRMLLNLASSLHDKDLGDSFALEVESAEVLKFLNSHRLLGATDSAERQNIRTFGNLWWDSS